MLPVSTPEATALDLVRYSRHIGGLDAVLTVLGELAESMNPAGLAAAASAESESAQIQRLGWLLDRLGQIPLADALHATLLSSKLLPRALLDPGAPRIGTVIETPRHHGGGIVVETHTLSASVAPKDFTSASIRGIFNT